MPLIVKCYLMEELIKNEIFDVLRTKEQLGYVVSCLTHVVHGYGGLLSIVQSDSVFRLSALYGVEVQRLCLFETPGVLPIRLRVLDLDGRR